MYGVAVFIKLTSLTFLSDSVLKKWMVCPEWSSVHYMLLLLLLFDKALLVFLCFALPGFDVAMRDSCWILISKKMFSVSHFLQDITLTHALITSWPLFCCNIDNKYLCLDVLKCSKMFIVFK